MLLCGCGYRVLAVDYRWLVFRIVLLWYPLNVLPPFEALSVLKIYGLFMFNHAAVCIQHFSLFLCLPVCLSFTVFLESEDKSSKNGASIKRVRGKSAEKYACGEAGLVKIRAEALLRRLGRWWKWGDRLKGWKTWGSWQSSLTAPLSTLTDCRVCISDANELYNMCRKVPGANSHADWGG